MADEDDDEDEAEDADGDDDDESSEKKAKPKQEGNQRTLFIIIGLIFLLFAGGLAGIYFTGLMDPVIAMIVGTNEEDAEKSKEGIFYDLEEMRVNLNRGSDRSRFLSIKVSLELAKPEDIALVEKVMPRIVDRFKTYLSELRIDDLKGSAGMYRLREELLRRVSLASAPAEIRGVLFREMLIE